MNTAKQISVLDFLEVEVDKLIVSCADIPESNNIDAEQDFDGGWMFDFDNTSRDYEIPIILDNEVDTLQEFVETVACLIDDRLDAPYPDDNDGPSLVWNPEYKVSDGILTVITDWEIVFGYWDGREIKKKRLDNITIH